MIILAIKDLAIESFGQPIYTPHIGGAMRSFINEVNSKGSPMNMNPEDFELWEIGTYEETTGTIRPTEPVRIARAIEHKKAGE